MEKLTVGYNIYLSWLGFYLLEDLGISNCDHHTVLVQVTVLKMKKSVKSIF